MTAPAPHTVLILGAGLTGLAAAHFLNKQGHRVTLLNCPAWQDGYNTDRTDAAPILFGRHRETWRLLRAVESGTASLTDRTVPLEFRLPDGRVAAYRSAHLPGALQWMTGLLSFHGLAWHDRWTLFSHLEQIWEQAHTLPADLDNRIADEWLASIGQSREARAHVWNPLSQWLTGNALEHLSAAVFVQQASALFLGRTMDARLTYLHGPVGDRLIDPIKQALDRQGTQILLETEPPNLRFGLDGVGGIRLCDGTLLRAQWYVAALSHRRLLSLLPEHLLTRYAYFAQLGDLETVPEIAIQFTRRSMSPSPRLLLLAGRPFHQLTTVPMGPNEIGCRLSAIDNPALMELDDDHLIDLGRTELRMLSPDIEHEEPLSGKVSRNDQAALSLKPGTALCRPIQQSPITNLMIAGAWTDTGWPANVESAIASATRCAEIISSHAVR